MLYNNGLLLESRFINTPPGLQIQISPAAFSVFTFPLCPELSPNEFIPCKLLVQADKHFILNPLQISDLLVVLLAEKVSNCLHFCNIYLPHSPASLSIQELLFLNKRLPLETHTLTRWPQDSSIHLSLQRGTAKSSRYNCSRPSPIPGS